MVSVAVLPTLLSVSKFKTGIDQSGNIAYWLRGIYRGEIVPKHRRIDYMYRGVFMTMVNTLMTELVFRWNNSWYIMPQLTRVLGLNKLSLIFNDPDPDASSRFVNQTLKSFQFKDIKNYSSIQEVDALRRRTCESAFKPESLHLVPHLVEDDLRSSLDTKAFENTAALRLHLRRRLNYEGREGFLEFLKAQGKITHEECETTRQSLKELKAIIDEIHSDHKNTKAGQGGKLSTAFGKFKQQWQGKHKENRSLSEKLQDMSVVDHEGFLNKNILEELKGFADEYEPLRKWVEKLSHYEKTAPRIAGLIEDGYVSRKIAMAIRKVQKSGWWPKMLTGVALTFIVYGYCSSHFEIDVVLPWQRKIFKQRGETDEAIRPAVLSTLPALLTFVALRHNKLLGRFMRKTGYVPELLLSGLVAIGVYLATFFHLFNRVLKSPPKHPVPETPKPQPMPTFQPPVFVPTFPMAPSVPTASLAATPFQLPTVRPAFQVPVS